MSKTATLTIDGNSYDFPLVEGTENEVAMNICDLRSRTAGIITIDPGYKNTGFCESAITFLVWLPFRVRCTVLLARPSFTHKDSEF